MIAVRPSGSVGDPARSNSAPATWSTVYALNADKTDYDSVLPADAKKSKLRKPMPISITFFANQGDEPVLLKIGSAYESATHHRFAPPDFGPVSAKRKPTS